MGRNLQTQKTQTFAQFVVKRDMPHLIAYGPPGTGKTSAILAMARQMFGNHYSSRVIEINASERGINSVRNKIKKSASMDVGKGFKEDGTPIPNFKIIVMDEADHMTKEAQNALRMIIEEYSSVTRFCFMCNYLDKIIDPIKSRCAEYQFKALENDVIHERLLKIAKTENIKIGKDEIITLTEISGGDMRQAIMNLQNINYFCSFSKNKITREEIYIRLGYAIDSDCEDMLKICLENDLQKIVKLSKTIIGNSYPVINIIKQLNNLILSKDKLTDDKKCQIIFSTNYHQKNLLKNGDEYLQLLGFLCDISEILKK
jgi:replication factor C subunit 2/4